MKIIDGTHAKLGRLASYVAKEALKGEEIVVVNCREIVLTGNKADIQNKFKQKRERVGSGQKGPKVSRNSERIVKRAIRGMLPSHRQGRGRTAFKKIKCFNKVPEEYKESKKIQIEKVGKTKHIKVKEVFGNG